MDAVAAQAALDEVRSSLATLVDVAGITGSFIFTRAGRLIARQLPPLFDDAALSEASGRLIRMQETFAAAGDHLDVAVLRFRDHKLYVKTFSGGVLCIISEGVVNMPALRMAANLVSRRIAATVESVAAATLPVAAAAAAPPRVAALAPPGMRRFRGRPVE